MSGLTNFRVWIGDADNTLQVFFEQNLKATSAEAALAQVIEDLQRKGAQVQHHNGRTMLTTSWYEHWHEAHCEPVANS